MISCLKDTAAAMNDRSPMPNLRICIVAEHASTRFGGEAILPVHYFRYLRQRGIEAWLVVHSRTRGEVLELFPDGHDRIQFVPDLWIHKLLFRLSRFLPRRLSESTFGLANQLITQFYQRSLVRRLIREKRVNVVHQPIPVAPRFPSAIYGLGVPVVIGPLNGGMEYPQAFRESESFASRTAIAVGRAFSTAVSIFVPGKRKADVVLVANDRTRRALPSGMKGRVIELVENGVDVDLWQGTGNSAPAATSRFVFIGRLVDWKALDIVIRALEQVPAAELEVIGDGPMMEVWKRLAGEPAVKGRVAFTGWLPQPECAQRLSSAVALVLPSVYECGGAVVLEAMTSGKPVIATDWGGPSDYLDDTCGILVDPDNYAALVDGFAAGMKKLLASPELALAMGQAGRERATRLFNWSGKVDELVRIYDTLIPRFESTPAENRESRSSTGVPGQETF